MSEELTYELKALLGIEGLICMAECFGGRRLYIPETIGEDHELAQAIGQGGARKLANRYARATLRIPLARELRARHYRAHGLSNGQIATKLGMTETGVDKMFGRMERPPEKGSGQLSLDFGHQ